MSETTATIIAIILIFGQFITLFVSRQVAVKYYFFAAPLGYFEIWFLLTLNSARACGVLLLAGGLLLWPVLKTHRFNFQFMSHPLFPFSIYFIVTTVVGSIFFWPIDAIASRSTVYGSWRGYVQILNWLIFIGVGWQISIALSQKDGFDRIRESIITIGIFHSIYAIYQTIAYYTGLPLTGIRRAAEDITSSLEGEQMALNNFEGFDIYRATSLVGEPKSFGAFTLIWITLILTLYLEKKNTPIHNWVLALFVVALGLTFSTSAWAGALIALVLYFRLSGFGSQKLLGVGLILIASFYFVLSSGLVTLSTSDILDLAVQTSSERVVSGGLQDLAEVEAIKVLTDQPAMAIFGTGLGGMSFYIAESLGGFQETILFPNTGLLGFLCDLGIVGIGLFLFAVYSGLRPSIYLSGAYNPRIRSLSYVGTTLLAQCFIFGGGILPFAIAFLLATEFLNKQIDYVEVMSVGKNS